MAAAQKPEKTESTAVAKRVDSRVAELRERNELVRAIRATQWGNAVSEQVARAVAHYCNTNGLDATRHVELLGGRIYLTASFYEERGAPLLRSGEVKKAQPDFIHADDRLTELAAKGDDWAAEEDIRRLRLRIQHGVPEAAKAACIQKFTLSNGTEILGINWCGGVRPKTRNGGDADPIGEAEPTKTAETRAARRAWKQIADVIPGYGEMVKPAETTARIASEALPVEVVDAPRAVRPLITSGTDPYDAGAAVNSAPVPPAQHADHVAGDDVGMEWQDDREFEN